MRTFAQKPKATQQTTSSKSAKPSRAFLSQSRDVQSILHLQRTIGNQAVLRLLQTATEKLDASSESSASTRSTHDFSHIRVQANALRNIQSKPTVNPLNSNKNLINRLNRSEGGGKSLSNDTQAFFEPRMQFDFDNVRIHSDNESFQMNRQLSARAFTYGRDIFFGAGQYKPESYDGKRLLAHELTHVVQQNGAKQHLNKNTNPPHIHRESPPSVMRQILLKIIKYPGSTMFPNVDVGVADHIYNPIVEESLSDVDVDFPSYPCGIGVRAVVNDASDLVDLRGDTTLDFDSPNKVSAVKRRANATGSSEVPVAYVEDILFNNRRGYSGYTLHDLVAVSNRSDQPHILAHEVGHFFGLEHEGHGSQDLMYEDPDSIGYKEREPPRLLQSDCGTVGSHIQPKLTVSTPGDIYEQEADRVADQVMHMPAPHLQHAFTCSGASPNCIKEQRDHEQLLTTHADIVQQRSAPSTTVTADSNDEQHINVSLSAIMPMPVVSATSIGIQREQATTPLVFSGHRTVTVQHMPPADIRSRCNRREGCFHHHGRPWEQDNVLSITFSPTIYLNNTLDPAEAAEVETHERRHYQDFLALAEALEDALTRHGISQWQDRWSLFLHDVCRASATFHRQEGTGTVETCLPPSSLRP
jgi:hypothetical protein